MQNHDISEARNTFGQRRDGRERENETEANVRYKIIGRNNVHINTNEARRAMTKDDSHLLDKDRESINKREQNETALKRFRKKFLRKKRVKSNEEEVGSENVTSEERDMLGRSSPISCDDHIYEVPFCDLNVDDDNSKEHMNRNGPVNSKTNSAGFRRGSGNEHEVHENGTVRSLNEAGQVKRQLINDGAINRRERWQQNKSMSLPAPRVSAKPPNHFPMAAVGSSSGGQRKLSCETSSGDSSGEDKIDLALEPWVIKKKDTTSMFLRSRSLPAPSKLKFNHHFVNGLNDLCKCGWYWGPLSSKEAEVKLHGKEDGTFLVRDSNDNRYLLSLSFRSEGRTLHTRIEFCKGKFSFYSAPFISSGCHESIVELIEDCVQKSKEKVFCYSKGRGHNGAAFPVRLMKPLSRFEHICTLQHLCRFVIRQHFTLENIGDMPLPGMMKKYLGKNHFDAKQG